MAEVTLKIGGMSCSACAATIEKHLRAQPGVQSASVNLVLARAHVVYDDRLTVADLEQFVRDSGYQSLGVYDETAELARAQQATALTSVYFYGGLLLVLMYVAMAHMVGLPVIPGLHMLTQPLNYALALLLLTLPFLYYGRQVLGRGARRLLAGHPNMDSLIARGQVQLVENLYFDAAAMIIYFTTLGKILENRVRRHTTDALRGLVQITPERAVVRRDDQEVSLTIDEVRIGETLVARPGDKIAVDGVVTAGQAHLDEAFITGESQARQVGAGQPVLAGMVNLDGYLEYRAERIGPQSTISQIVHLVNQTLDTKPELARLADTLSGYFVPVLLLVALLTLGGNYWLTGDLDLSLMRAVTVLVVACPCALGLATPLAVVTSVGQAAQQGLLIKSSHLLEVAAQVDTVIFDKTGTLTYGQPRLVSIHSYQGDASSWLPLVVSLETHSQHPLARALTAYAQAHRLSLGPVAGFINHTGAGLSGQVAGHQVLAGNERLLSLSSGQSVPLSAAVRRQARQLAAAGQSLIYVACDGQLVGLLGVQDQLRPEVSAVTAQLHQLGVRQILLSGDHQAVVQALGQALPFDQLLADQQPSDKLTFLEQQRQAGHVTMMVGDGINDAPSLTAADVGVSLESGTQIAADAAGVILLGGQLTQVITLLQLSRRTVRIIKQNLAWACGYNLLMIPLAAGLGSAWGWQLSPMLASGAMVLSSLTVTLNSLRLRRPTATT